MKLNDLPPDFQDLLRSFTSQNVDFLLVGAHALAFHGAPRYTQDLDLWVQSSRENAARIRAALDEFGVPLGASGEAELLEERRMVRFGHPPLRVELLNFLDGCEYDTAKDRAIQATVSGSEVRILGIRDYILTKRASGRPKDIADLALLAEALGTKPEDL